MVLNTDHFNGNESITSVMSLDDMSVSHESDSFKQHKNDIGRLVRIIDEQKKEIHGYSVQVFELKAVHNLELTAKEAKLIEKNNLIAELKAEKKAGIAEKVLSLTKFLNKLHEAELAKKETAMIKKLSIMHQEVNTKSAFSVVQLKNALAEQEFLIEHCVVSLAEIQAHMSMKVALSNPVSMPKRGQGRKMDCMDERTQNQSCDNGDKLACMINSLYHDIMVSLKREFQS